MRTPGSSIGMSGGGGGSGNGSSGGGGCLGCAWASAPASKPRSSRRRIASILLEVQEHLALGRRGREAALLVEREDRIHHLLRLVVHLHKVEVILVDHPFGGQPLAH